MEHSFMYSVKLIKKKKVVSSKSSRNSLAQFTEITTVKEEMYIDILCRLRDAVWRKSHEKWRTTRWFLLHDNAPAHRSVLAKDFLAKNNVTTLKHRPYSPDLTPADFYLFPRLKSVVKDGVIVTDIIKNATEELKRLSQNGFQQCFQYLYSRWQTCIVLKGDYTEGNVS